MDKAEKTFFVVLLVVAMVGMAIGSTEANRELEKSRKQVKQESVVNMKQIKTEKSNFLRYTLQVDIEDMNETSKEDREAIAEELVDQIKADFEEMHEKGCHNMRVMRYRIVEEDEK